MQSHDKAFVLLHRLSDGHFHSGQVLADALGVSRTSIASYIHQLQAMGVDIYSVKGRGYCLAHPISLLDETLLQGKIDAPVHVFSEIDSTNSWMMQRLEQLVHGELISCDYQSAGRGRRGRGFASAVAGQLPFSLHWTFEGGFESMQGLSLVVGVAVAEALKTLGFEQIGLKWPNDIYAGYTKLAGILIEMNGQPQQLLHIVAGIGLNVRLGEVSASIDQPVTDLSQLSEQFIDRNTLLLTCYQHLMQAYEQFCQSGLAPFIERWNQLDIFHGESVKLIFSDGHVVNGKVNGIDSQGKLLLNQQGNLRSFNAGEVSLRPQ
ncbi:bifunctional biotin--[acetyl-CoA-carboxylase] ligase/biotin operon repressor BirA [Celerinatantimonas sp. MCCC 1A17872]|uniref:bifunctional biotin--[acetyl-CoA-carboxylase] ligase/biotin operon repressor BirA n=1 Tax=Celerinatantimonas sp. MCCC 1A17872 TaxID=3177514 RepID=UPI0038C64905